MALLHGINNTHFTTTKAGMNKIMCELFVVRTAATIMEHHT
jgi:hypothetical protein